jgi:hypothetical protein
VDEQFADNRLGWPDNPQGTAWIADGGYHLFARDATRFVAVSAPLAGPVRDGVIRASFRKVGGPAGGGYGLIVRDQGPKLHDGVNQTGRYYVFEICDRGELGVWRRDGDHWVDMVPWVPSSAVRPGGAPNDLVLRSTGDRLAFLVNGTEVAVSTDATLGAGGVGLFAGGDGNQVIAERLVVQVPE